nr:PREDICTED: phenylalanine--tRNA ligase alpha subunit-like [Equus przewalskii]
MADGPVADVLLRRLEAADGGLDSAELAAELGVEHQAVVGAVKSLQALGEIIEAELRSTKRWELTAEGEEIAREGSHEARVFRPLPVLCLLLRTVFWTLKTYWVSKGSAFSTSVSKQEAELSPEMISSGSWRDRPFKPYNFSARGVLPDSGHLHPLLKVRTQFRQIFLEMGFTEMPTDNFIESSFWNFDALFQPQQHPARDQHDTFFLQDPAEALQLPMDYVHRVKRTHSQGGYGSQG